MNQDPNTFEDVNKDANANPDVTPQSTETETTANPMLDAEPAIDYERKFAESSKEALRLLEETRAKEAEIERLRQELEAKGEVTPTDDEVYPGFEELDHEAQANLTAYTNMIKKQTKDELYKDPAISFAVRTYNESKFDKAMAEVLTKYPNLAETKDKFKAKYFNPTNTPDNIEAILDDVAKIHLFDEAKKIGAEEEKQKANRIDLERTTGGDRNPTTVTRSLEDWNRMAQDNPAEFAKHSKEYHADLASGKI